MAQLLHIRRLTCDPIVVVELKGHVVDRGVGVQMFSWITMVE